MLLTKSTFVLINYSCLKTDFTYRNKLFLLKG